MTQLFERLLHLVKILENNSQTQFAKKVGCPQTTLNGYLRLDGQDKIKVAFLDKILVAYPEISRMWLYFGEGSVFAHEDGAEKPGLEARIEILENEVQLLRNQIFVDGLAVQDSKVAKAARQE